MYRYPRVLLLAGLCPVSFAALRRQRRSQEASSSSSSSVQTSSSVSLAGEARPSLQPNFFNAFSEGESTYDEAFFHRPHDVLGSVSYEDHAINAVDANVFEETPSAGAAEALQTYWPGDAQVNVNRIGPKPSWEYSNVEYVEPYLPSGSSGDGTGGSTLKAAQWFDTSVLKYNGLGQPQLPPKGTGARLKADGSWVQRAMNTSLQCKEAGCTATSKLKVYDPSDEEVSQCRLSIQVHPTDFDNQWSQEFIKTWKVNDHLATVMCNPNAMGCNASHWRPLVPCLQDLSVDHLLETGSLVIEGTINKLVDECPYEGFLLNGVATVTCMARLKPVLLARTPPNAEFGGASAALRQYANGAAGTAGAAGGSGTAGGGSGTAGAASVWGSSGVLGAGGALGAASAMGAGVGADAAGQGAMNASQIATALRDRLAPGMTFRSAANLRCCAPGCSARGVVQVDPVILRAGATCLLNFSVVQTDFDEAVGNDRERIEFIDIEGLGNVSTHVKPGRNPCTEEYSTGKKISMGDRVFTVFHDQNVTQQLLNPPLGFLSINSKISDQVDDCAWNDSLFDAMATVTCKLPQS